MDQRTYRRRRYVVNPPLQYRFVGIMLLVLLLMTAGALGSVYFALWVVLQLYNLTTNSLAIAQLTTAGLVVTVELLLMAPVVVWIGIRQTHKVAGPLLRIHGAVQRMAQGDLNIHLKLRKGDALVELAEAINALAASLRLRKP